MGEYDAFAQVEREGWADTATAEAYARDFAQAAAHCVPAFVALAKVQKGDRVLDLCCGHGIIAAGLVKTGAEVTGADFSPPMLAAARLAVPGARFVEEDAQALTFADHSFDAVVIGFGIPHVPDPKQVMAEARRVLKPGGRLVYSVWKSPVAEDAFAIVFDAIEKHGDPHVQLPPGPGAHDYALPVVARQAMTASGFGEVTLTDVASFWEVGDPGAPFDYFIQGTVRGGAVLRPQSDRHKNAIRRAVAEAVSAKPSKNGVWRVSVPAVLVSGVAI